MDILSVGDRQELLLFFIYLIGDTTMKFINEPNSRFVSFLTIHIILNIRREVNHLFLIFNKFDIIVFMFLYIMYIYIIAFLFLLYT